MGFSNHCCNIHGPLFFFFSKAKKKIKNKVWMLTQICHAIRVVVLLQIKTKKQKSECRTSPSELICTTLFFSPFRARRSDPSEGEKKKGSGCVSTHRAFTFPATTKCIQRGFFFLFGACATAAKSKKLKAKARKKQKTGAACSEGICDYH